MTESFDSKTYDTISSLIDSGKFHEAIDSLDKLLWKNRQDIKALNLKGLALHYLGRHNDARKCFEEALELRPKEAILRGNIAYNLKMYDLALQCYDKAIELHPQNDIAWRGRGAALIATGKFEEAMECYDKALHINPNDKVTWYSKGSSLSHFKKPDYFRILTCFSKALEIDPNFRLAKLGKRQVLSSLEQLGVRVCSRCNERTKEAFEPIDYWDFEGKLCKPCYIEAQENTHVYNGRYIEKQSSAHLETEGRLMTFFMDNRMKVIFEPKDTSILPILIDKIEGCEMTPESNRDIGKALLMIRYGGAEHEASAIFYIEENTQEIRDNIHSALLKGLRRQQEIPVAASSSKTEDTKSPEKDVSKGSADMLKCNHCATVIPKKVVKFGSHICPFCGNKLTESNT